MVSQVTMETVPRDGKKKCFVHLFYDNSCKTLVFPHINIIEIFSKLGDVISYINTLFIVLSIDEKHGC